MRFTDEKKWSDKWFRGLSSSDKLIWIFLCDNCSVGGFIEYDPEYISFMTKLSEDTVNQSIDNICSKLEIINDVIWIKKFIHHQKNLPLNPANNAHKAIIRDIKEHVLFIDAQDLIDENSNDEFRVCLSQRETVWIRDKGICQYTSAVLKSNDDYEVDHIHPRSKGGSDRYINLACCSKSFNRDKSDSLIPLTVRDYSASAAKKALMLDPVLLNSFNSFFNRSIHLNDQQRLVEVNGYLGANDTSVSPIGKGKGKGKGKGRPVILAPPTLEEVKAYFKEKGYKTDSAIRAFNAYSENNWHDSNNKPVKNWKLKMNNVWFKPENLASEDHPF